MRALAVNCPALSRFIIHWAANLSVTSAGPMSSIASQETAVGGQASGPLTLTPEGGSAVLICSLQLFTPAHHRQVGIRKEDH